jgi:hypothetical protein
MAHIGPGVAVPFYNCRIATHGNLPIHKLLYNNKLHGSGPSSPCSSRRARFQKEGHSSATDDAKALGTRIPLLPPPFPPGSEVRAQSLKVRRAHTYRVSTSTPYLADSNLPPVPIEKDFWVWAAFGFTEERDPENAPSGNAADRLIDELQGVCITHIETSLLPAPLAPAGSWPAQMAEQRPQPWSISPRRIPARRSIAPSFTAPGASQADA